MLRRVGAAECASSIFMRDSSYNSIYNSGRTHDDYERSYGRMVMKERENSTNTHQGHENMDGMDFVLLERMREV